MRVRITFGKGHSRHRIEEMACIPRCNETVVTYEGPDADPKYRYFKVKAVHHLIEAMSEIVAVLFTTETTDQET